jgi:oxygen-independent coproporphyrinogen-3 oxidase
LEEGTRFHHDGIELWPEDQEAQCYEMIVSRMKAAGYDHYEISSFCKPGFASRHNLAYWQDEEFMGIGPGAWGREGQRYVVDRNFVRIPEETDRPFEAVMMGLRTSAGIDLAAFQRRYGFDPRVRWAYAIEKWKPFFVIHERMALTEAGRELLNEILLDFMDDE